LLITGQTKEKEIASLLLVNTQVTTKDEQNSSGRTQLTVTFARKAISQKTHGKLTTSSLVTQTHH
jgi:hypothetical protein